MGFSTVLTTNFDFLLEHAYTSVHRRCLPIVDEAQLSAPNRYPGPRVIKLHGDLHHPPRLVLTEDDYDSFLLSQPLFATTVAALFVDHTPILIGYSLDDPDTRQLLALVRNRLGKHARPLWTILFGAPAHVVDRFQRRGVQVVNIPRERKKSLGELYTQLFDELTAYLRERLPARSVGADERVTADLRLPKESSSRLCYFAIPHALVSWYREHVFPLVEAHGLVPVTAGEVFTAGDAVTAKIETLIDRATAIIAEPGTATTNYEAGLAAGIKDPHQVLLIASESSLDATPARTLGSWNRAMQFAVRPTDLNEKPIRLLEAIARWLQQLEARPRELHEPERLLKKGEFGPALISAVAELEGALRRLVKEDPLAPRKLSLRELLMQAQREGIVRDPVDVEVLDRAMSQRNHIVHGGARVADSEIRALVEQVMRVLRSFDNRY